MRARRIEGEGLQGLTREERILASLLRAANILHPNMPDDIGWDDPSGDQRGNRLMRDSRTRSVASEPFVSAIPMLSFSAPFRTVRKAM